MAAGVGFLCDAERDARHILIFLHRISGRHRLRIACAGSCTGGCMHAYGARGVVPGRVASSGRKEACQGHRVAERDLPNAIQAHVQARAAAAGLSCQYE